MKNIKTFLDSDVVISSLLSKTGAAYLLVNSNYPLTKYISTLSILELGKVITKLKITKTTLNETVNTLDIVELEKNAKKVKESYLNYVRDKDDAHIVAGAVKAKTRFLITYNIKDYKTNKLKMDHKIVVITPGSFLQYLRGLKLN